MIQIFKNKNLIFITSFVCGLAFLPEAFAQCESVFGKFHDSSGSPDSSQISTLIEQMKDVTVRTSRDAQEALFEIGAPAVPALIEQLKSENPRDRGQAANVLGRIGDRRAVAPLIQYLEDKSLKSFAKSDAVIALGKIKDPEGIPALMDALRSTDLKEHATEALKNIGEPAFEALLTTLSGTNTAKSAAAALALGEFKDQRAVYDLTQALYDQRFENSWEVRLTAVVALKKIGHPSALQALMDVAQNDPVPQIRRVAQNATENMGRWE